MGRHERKTPRLARWLAGVAVAGALFGAGFAAGAGGSHAPQNVTQQGPRGCANPVLPSGDAMRAHGQEFVCTDGAWIHVSGYGSPARNSGPAVSGHLSHLRHVRHLAHLHAEHLRHVAHITHERQ
jgi:hypothetical protein